ncbi:MAG: hypothetical protein E2604_05495 [Flavobacterium sp.]|nr:hypothetical protein [Flavobacterium sp.]
MTVKDYCVAIHKILMEVGELHWAKCFSNFISELEAAENHTVFRKILSIYGGMGSFNDLVLYHNGTLCQKENEALSELRKGLYTEIGKEWK